MKSRKLIIIAATLCIVTVLMMTIGPTTLAAPKNGKSNATAKNVILLISDGGGFNQYLAADYYQYGRTGKQVYEKFPVQLAVSTYENEWILDENGDPILDENGDPIGYEIYGYDTNLAWSDFEYPIWTHPSNPLYVNNCTDSASAATAMATGVKTKDGRLGTDVNGAPLYPNVTEYAESLGKSTGVVSSVPLSHATPAGFVAHHDNRNAYAEITDQMIYTSAVDVIMTPGSPDYDHDGNLLVTPKYKYISSTTWTDICDGSVTGADANGDGNADTWTVIHSLSEFQNMARGNTPSRVLGIANVAESLQFYRSGNATADAFEVPYTPNMPTLVDMTKAALNVLDNDKDGFFLMVEGGAVDWACHFWQPGRMIEEQIDFNNTVQAVCDWVQKNSNWGETLVIVTADHETGYIWGPGSGEDPDDLWKPIVNNGVGNMPDFEFYSVVYGVMSWHSNSLVPLFAKGDAARLFNAYADETDLVRGAYLDNTEIYQIMHDVMTPKDKPDKAKGSR